MKFKVLNNVDINELDFSVRTWNCLRRAQINTIQDIVDNFDNLNKVRNLGQRCYDEIVEKIKPYVEEPKKVDITPRRDRLVELVGCASREYAEYSAEMFNAGNYGMESLEEYVTDYLLKRGVIVPPCKVGDTAYFVLYDGVDDEWFISEEPIVDVCTKGFYTSGKNGSTENDDLWLWSCVGDDTFFDKEEAEKALKERDRK